MQMDADHRNKGSDTNNVQSELRCYFRVIWLKIDSWKITFEDWSISLLVSRLTTLFLVDVSFPLINNLFQIDFPKTDCLQSLSRSPLLLRAKKRVPLHGLFDHTPINALYSVVRILQIFCPCFLSLPT